MISSDAEAHTAHDGQRAEGQWRQNTVTIDSQNCQACSSECNTHMDLILQSHHDLAVYYLHILQIRNWATEKFNNSLGVLWLKITRKHRQEVKFIMDRNTTGNRSPVPWLTWTGPLGKSFHPCVSAFCCSYNRVRSCACKMVSLGQCR